MSSRSASWAPEQHAQVERGRHEAEDFVHRRHFLAAGRGLVERLLEVFAARVAHRAFDAFGPAEQVAGQLGAPLPAAGVSEATSRKSRRAHQQMISRQVVGFGFGGVDGRVGC
ncbi:hypothetical protein [Amycolatopsis sp. NPDC049159]|uniref:hypothetical protein n=1 Tax=Amycolatopsis sp. NPDC049159 TaxID=3157210 RepID=UPI0034048C17